MARIKELKMREVRDIDSENRGRREIEAYASGKHRENRRSLYTRFSHVYSNPNSQRQTDYFEEFVRGKAQNRDVLDVGCGTGWSSQQILEMGPRSVDGIDISADMLNEARAIDDSRLRFFEADVTEGVFKHTGRKYDLIVGRAILHHLDYKKVLKLLYSESLAPGGSMIFLEPLGEGLMMKTYWRFTKALHTPDERPFYAHDIAWMESEFPGFSMTGFNFFSFPASVVSSAVFRKPDNALLKLTDRLDWWLTERFKFFKVRCRSAIFQISEG